MLRVHRTDTDEIVLIHEPSQTVVVDDTFDAAMARLRERLGDGFDAAVAPPPEPRAQTNAPTPWARYGLLGLLVALPFLWLGALHVSLGSLVVELRRDAKKADRDAVEHEDDAASLRAEVDAIGRRVDRLVDDVSTLKRGGERKAAAQPLPDEDEGEGEDEGEDEGDEEPPGAASDDAEAEAAPAPSPRPGGKSGAESRAARPNETPPT
jgi:hypothetical protein